MPDVDHNEAECPIQKAMMIIGKRWTALIVRDLVTGTKRFCQLEHSLNGISPKMLSSRLHELECEGLVCREVYAEVPVRVEYSLTDKGMDLREVIDSMAAWGERWQ
jgi:DNA-binding HxlR family transcriptional regulator